MKYNNKEEPQPTCLNPTLVNEELILLSKKLEQQFNKYPIVEEDSFTKAPTNWTPVMASYNLNPI